MINVNVLIDDVPAMLLHHYHRHLQYPHLPHHLLPLPLSLALQQRMIDSSINDEYHLQPLFQGFKASNHPRFFIMLTQIVSLRKQSKFYCKLSNCFITATGI